jgi:hypothetical protein
MKQRYLNRSGKSGVTHYDASASDEIKVWFKNGEGYAYTCETVGPKHVAQLRTLAASGRGLSGYISRHVHDLYSAKC